MAIDTVNKRASIPGVGRPWMRSKWPDANKDQAWRAAVGNAWAGAVILTVAPVLSLPTAVGTGRYSGSGTVTTDKGEGTLYYLVSENASESAANIKSNGESQSVVATGVQNVSFEGLTLDTTYYLHFMQEDDELLQSNVESVSFSTSTFLPWTKSAAASGSWGKDAAAASAWAKDAGVSGSWTKNSELE